MSIVWNKECFMKPKGVHRKTSGKKMEWENCKLSGNKGILSLHFLLLIFSWGPALSFQLFRIVLLLSLHGRRWQFTDPTFTNLASNCKNRMDRKRGWWVQSGLDLAQSDFGYWQSSFTDQSFHQGDYYKLRYSKYYLLFYRWKKNESQ